MTKLKSTPVGATTSKIYRSCVWMRAVLIRPSMTTIVTSSPDTEEGPEIYPQLGTPQAHCWQSQMVFHSAWYKTRNFGKKIGTSIRRGDPRSQALPA